MEDTLSSNIAHNVLELRQLRGLSQDQVAKLSGIPRPTLANLETGSSNPTVKILSKVASALQVSVQELISSPKAWARHYPAHTLSQKRRGNVNIRKLLPDVSQSMELDRMEFPPEATMIGVPHRSGTREYLICESGAVDLTVTGEKYKLEPGDVVVFRGDQRHSYHNPLSKLSIAYSVVMIAPPNT